MDGDFKTMFDNCERSRSTDLAAPPAEADNVDKFVETAERYRKQFVWLVWRMTGCSNEAEDIVQVAFTTAFTKLHQFRGDAQMKTWLWVIVRNAARDYLRIQRRRVFIPFESLMDESGDIVLEHIRDSTSNPEESCVRRDLMEFVRDEMQRLDSFSMKVMKMYVFDELPQAAVADSLQTSISAVKQSVFKAKRMLAEAVVPVNCQPGGSNVLSEFRQTRQRRGEKLSKQSECFTIANVR